jgi:DNA repair exonuclease SbcCD ATPase subunit
MESEMHILLQERLDRVRQLSSVYNQRFGKLAYLRQELANVTAKIETLEKELDLDTKTRMVLELLSKLTEQEVKDYIEPLVTEALRAVFGYDLTFGIQFGFERNQVVAAFSLMDGQGNKAEGDIEEMKGGGVLDVISLVLRFVLLELFGLPGPVVLDEPGRFVDRKHQPAFGELILSFATKFNRQIVIVTHDDAICAIGGLHYHVAQDDQGVSHVTQVVEG